MTQTGWTAKTGFGRYLRHRYPHYDQLRGRPPKSAATLAWIGDATTLLAAGRYRATAGGAFHHRIGLLYQDVDLTTRGATAGRRRAVGNTGGPDSIWVELCERALELARAVRGRERVDPESAEEIELARLCALLTLYEQVDVSRAQLPIMAEPASSPPRQLLAWVHDDDVRDVLLMTALYLERFPHDLATVPVLVEPNLHPGVADLLLGGLLLELKSTGLAYISDEFAYTLLGYVLQTSPDFPSPGVPLTHVGWYFARQGLPWIFEADDFLSIMAGVPVTLAAARDEFELVYDPEGGQLPLWARDLMLEPVSRGRLNRPGRAGPP